MAVAPAGSRSFGRAVASSRLHKRIEFGCERQVSGYNDVAYRVLIPVSPLLEFEKSRIEENSFEPDRIADIAGNMVFLSFGPIINLDITAL